ncbi:MAG: D-alanine--D-alanine ligase family protein [Gemmatimonadaceae bacterium]
MTRIGFAYNLKPDPSAPLPIEDATPSRPEEDPPSKRRDIASRTSSPLAVASRAGEMIASRRATTPETCELAATAADDEYAEWDSEETIAAVERALSRFGAVIRLEATEEFPERLRRERPDIVFNIAEGWRGVNREGHVPAICEFFGIPYSGSDPFTLSLSLDKARTKEWLSCHGVRTAPFVLLRDVAELESFLGGEKTIGSSVLGPRSHVFVKPVHEGSSKGITERNYCRTPDELEAQVAFLLERYEQPVLVEEYLPGAEFTCAILGNGDDARVLPIVGINFTALPSGALPVYGFEAKWLWDTPENPLEMFECPAQIDEALAREIERVALRAYSVLGCRDWSRIDVRLDAAGEPNVVEVNPLPGILPNPEDNSCFPKAARVAGMTYDELIQSCLRAASARQGVALVDKSDGPRTEDRGRGESSSAHRSPHGSSSVLRPRSKALAPRSEAGS